MASHHTTHPADRGVPTSVIAALVVAIAALLMLFLSQALAVSTPATSVGVAAPREPQGVGDDPSRVPDGTTVFDEVPAVTKLDPGLLAALRDAATDARREGITFTVNSGWRSREYQDKLLREAVSQYGSKAEAARWVATADTSPHVSGDAVDIGSLDATIWLSQHGAAYGLCQIYANERWHYELRPQAVGHGCPRMYADPTRDPRMAH